MSGEAKVPEPGVYRGIPMAEYRAWACASNSQLTHLMRSPAHLRAYLEAPQKETPARILGTAIHTKVLEPETFGRSYFAKPDPDPEIYRNADGSESKNVANTKAYKDAVAALEMEHPGGIGLGASDHETCIGIDASIRAHESAGPTIEAATDVELSIVWDDPVTGVRCKARLDAYAPDLAGGSIPDLKSAREGGILDFERAVLGFGYHRKAWFYLRGAREVGLACRHFPLIAAEKEPPYAVDVYRVSEGVVTYVEDQMTALLELYAECQQQEWWPARPEHVREISIPDYGWRKIDEQTAEVREQLARMRAARKREVA